MADIEKTSETSDLPQELGLTPGETLVVVRQEVLGGERFFRNIERKFTLAIFSKTS